MAKNITTENKLSNRSRIFNLIYQNNGVSKNKIAASLGLSLPTVINTIKLLQTEDLIEEGSPMKSTGGRKATAILCNENAFHSIGVDITTSSFRVVTVNLKAKITSRIYYETPFINNSEYWTNVSNIVKNLIQSSNIAHDKVLGIGISLPGIISNDGTTLIYSHVLKVSGLHVTSIEEYFDYKLHFRNDAKSAGYAEIWSDSNRMNALYLSLNNSVGGAIILANNLYFGENQRAGEFGHMTLVKDGQECYCGKKGCMDAYCSAKILSQHTNGDLHLFFQKLQYGDQGIINVWNEYIEWLAIAINNLTCAFDCKIILGGYLGMYIERYIIEIKSLVANINTFTGNEHYISVCKYKEDASAIGTALHFIDDFILNI